MEEDNKGGRTTMGRMAIKRMMTMGTTRARAGKRKTTRTTTTERMTVRRSTIGRTRTTIG